jgi:hypothetical protein
MALDQNSGTNCDCLWGIAVVDPDGGCRCVDEIPEGTGGIKSPIRGVRPITNREPVPPLLATTPAPAGDLKILGFSPLVVLGAAAVVLYILGSDGKP